MNRFIVKICLLMIAVFVTSQSKIEYPQIVPPSPTAYELGKYGNANVGLFTGSASISIPLMNFKSKNISIPVTLNYSTNGIKVDQLESNVGLGWTLNVGGVITRTIKDEPDELNGNYFPTEDINDLNSSFTLHYFNTAAQGQNDTETDEFSYNFAGYSGKFVYGNDKRIVQIPLTSLVIIPYIENSLTGYAIISPDGLKYIFLDSEYSISSQIGENHPTPQKGNTAWYLTRIEHPNGDKIYFTYLDNNYSFISGKSQSLSMAYPYFQNTCNMDGGTPLFEVEQTSTIVKSYSNSIYIKGKLLTNIHSNNAMDGEIYFSSNYSHPDISNYKLLSEIQYLNNDDIIVDKYVFEYNSLQNKRVVLNKLKTLDTNKNYIFEYNDATALPQRLSYSQDHWGYYNGKPNRYLLPKITDQPPFKDFNIGSDRSVNTTSTQKGLLTKITYPTGGTDEFVYEQNKYFGTGLITPPQYTTADVSAASTAIGFGGSEFTQNLTVNIPFNQTIRMRVAVELDEVCNEGYVSGKEKGSMTLKKVSSGELVELNFQNLLYVEKKSGTNFTPSDANIEYFAEIEAGDYTLSVTPTHKCVHITASMTYITQDAIYGNQNILCGGVRINKITTLDPSTGNSEVKRFYYGAMTNINESSAYVNFEPKYIYHNTVKKYCGPSIYDISYSHLTSSSIIPLYDSGNSVYYQFVTVSFGGENFENGGVQHEFIINKDIEAELIHGLEFIPNTSQTNTGWDNGFERETITFKKNTSGNIIPLSITTNHFIADTAHYEEVIGFTIRKNFDFPYSMPSTLTCTEENIEKKYARKICMNTDVTHQHYYTKVLSYLPGITNQNNYFSNIVNFYTTLLQLPSPIITDLINNGDTWCCIADGANNVDSYIYGPCYNHNIGDNISILSTIDNLDIMKYKHISYWFYQDSKTTTVYDVNGQNPVTTTEKYYYDKPEHLQLTRKDVINSDSKTFKEKYYYASDVNNTFLTNKYIIGEIVRTENYVDTNLINTTSINFTDWGNNLILPVSVDISLGNAPLEQKIQFLNYDLNNGNIKSYKGNDNVDVVYIWGYYGKYPIAEIRNATYTEVSAILIGIGTSVDVLSNSLFPDMTKVNVLRTVLPNAKVTTYTYQPLIGVSTITDQRGVTLTYEYDSLNRLQFIKNKDGIIIQSFDYKYKQQ